MSFSTLSAYSLQSNLVYGHINEKKKNIIKARMIKQVGFGRSAII